ncbi:hypothetical protein [Microbaculum sp. FT89]|uniref:hypothetical protein n=1 Tax=Microbaculum sp. FT89 TaxID=3447298 RepID=UPI003F5373B9
MSAKPFRPRVYGTRNYIRGVDFTVHVLNDIVAAEVSPLGAMDLRFPRFSTKEGQFAPLDNPSEGRGSAAILQLDRGGRNTIRAYTESDRDAQRSDVDPEAGFKGREQTEGQTAKIGGISGPDLFSAAVFLTKKLHERVVETPGKWIYTRFRAPSAQLILDLVADDGEKELEVRITALRENHSSVSDLAVDGTVVGEIFFARIPT